MLTKLWNIVRRGFPSLMKAEELYVIEGSHAPFRQEVEEAMRWLTSAETGHSGLKQLRAAYGLNARPL